MLSTFVISIDDYFKPIFDSYNKNKITFFLQVVNFLLVFILSNFTLDWMLKILTIGIKGSGILGMRILLLLIPILVLSAIKENVVLRWQTLFNMNRDYTKKWLKRFLILNIILYGAREYYVYAERNKK